MDTYYRVKLELTTEMLGTAASHDVYADHILTRAALTDEEAAEELASVEHLKDKGATGFRRNAEGQPIILDYMIKGFFKETCGGLRRDSDRQSKKLTAYKKQIDEAVFPFPRQIPIVIGEDGESSLSRPLRAQTMQGERVTVVKSETVPAGSTLEFYLWVMGSTIDEKLLREWLRYGKLKGLGQWRSGSHGRFVYELEEISEEEFDRATAISAL